MTFIAPGPDRRTRSRYGRVAAWFGAVLCAIGFAASFARSEEAESSRADPLDLLRIVEGSSATMEARVTAADALATDGRIDDVDRVLRALPALLPSAPAAAGRLLRAAREAGWASVGVRAALRAAVTRSVAAASSPEHAWDLAAVGVLLGDRALVTARLATGTPPTPFASDVLQADAPHVVWPDTGPKAKDWEAHASVADRLDRAVEDDPETAFPAMDALVREGASIVPFLSAVAAPQKPQPGRERTSGVVARRVRAVVLLGAIGDRRVVPALVPLLDDREDGWVRAATATALGDLGDPRAIGPLCRVILYLGDRHRPADLWDYPGVDNTDLSPEAWADVPYHAIDVAAADALLRLGVRNAAEWLIDERLDPRTGRWRVRVTQDAIEALLRAFPTAPTGYEPDAGFPQRQAAVDALRVWWKTGPVLARPLETRDEVVHALEPLAASVGGAGVAVMDLMIAKRACALVGPAMTPAIVRVLATSQRRVQRLELAVVLGALRDRRAVVPLLDLTRDPVSAVRAHAAEALGSYVDPDVPALYFGTNVVPLPAIRSRLVAMLDDLDAGPRASAVKALCAARPSEDVAAALHLHGRGTRKDNDFLDYRLAQDVALFVHLGARIPSEADARLDGIVAHLNAPDLFHRRYVWELLRHALRLDPKGFDPSIEPGAPGRLVPGREALRDALARRGKP